MRSRHAGMTVSMFIFGAPISRSLSSRGLVAIIALAVGLAVASPCFSQTISLGQAGQYNVFEATYTGTTPPVTPGTVDVTGSSIGGSIALGANATFISGPTLNTGPVYIGGAVYEDTGVTVYSSETTVAGGYQLPTSLTLAATNAATAWTTAAGQPNNNSFSGASPVNVVNSSLPVYLSNVALTINGNTGTVASPASPLNVVNFSNVVYLSGVTLTINGTSSEQFVFNCSGTLSLTDTTIVLNGVSASNVFFNILGGSVYIDNSTFNGNILDLAGSSSPIDLEGDAIEGSIISDSNITISGSPIDVPAGTLAVVPELPTNITAGLACLFLVLWNAGRNLLRRRRLALAVAPTQS